MRSKGEMNKEETKTKLKKELKNTEDNLVDLCSKFIKIENENPPGDMTDIAGYVKDYLNKYGCKYKVYEKERGRVNLVADLGVGEHPHLVWNGHMDVVPAGDKSRWAFDPYGGLVKDGYIHGRGASDMKCGLGAMIHAFTSVKRLDLNLQGRLTLMVVPDEETGSRFGTRYLLEEDIVGGDACIVGEPTGLDLVEIGQKGSVGGLIKVKGSPIHASLSPIKGDSAILKMCKVLSEILKIHEVEFKTPKDIEDIVEDNRKLYRELEGEGVERMLNHISVNLGVIRGGTKSNVVPEYCECTLDMRIPIGADNVKVQEMVRKAIKEAGVEGVTLEIQGRNAFYFSPKESIVKTVGDTVTEVLGREPRLFIQWACSDVAAFYAKGIPTIQYGPHGPGIHGYNEMAEVETVVTAAEVYALSAVDYLGTE
jgi:succinyl-diaminopimelate desuccinylase